MEQKCSATRANKHFLENIIREKMKASLKLLAIALTGLITGIAFATPLMISELEIRPYIRHIQGPTADFEIEVIFANFTILDQTQPASNVDDLSLSFQILLRVTNPSDLGATLLHVMFVAAEEIKSHSGFPLIGTNSSGGWGWEAEGAWVDGKWYNLTWVNGTYPYFDRDGNMVPPPFEIPWQTSYWMEGVQLYQRHVNGTIVGTYMNMNGTWVDVTGRIEVEEPDRGSGFSIKNDVVHQMRIFQDEVLDYSESSDSDGNVHHIPQTVRVMTGEGYFNNLWEPGESRIILLEGIQEIGSLWSNSDAVEVLNSGSITLRTTTFNIADNDFELVNNTVKDSWSYATELKTITLSREGDYYIFNIGLLETYSFKFDQWNAEVFLEPR